MKKIAHSELMTIRSSPQGAVESILLQVIVIGQGKAARSIAIISFLRFRRLLPAQSLRERATQSPFCARA